MKDVTSKWSTNETLLQSYRSIFITTQSIFLGIGVFTTNNLKMFLPIGIISLITIWLIWFPVVKSRQLAVDYFKYSLELSEEELEKLVEMCKNEKFYIQNKEIRKRANSILKCDKHWRTTRIKIDLIIPILFTITWIILSLMATNNY